MKQRQMISGDATVYSAEWCEISDEIDFLSYDTRLNAVAAIQQSTWPVFQAEATERTIVFEFRSDRGHLALVAIAPTEQEASDLLTNTMENFNV